METIPINKPYFDDEDIEAVKNAMLSTFVSGDGPECRAFEKELADYLGVKHAFFVNSATAALEIAFRVKNFPNGSEVIVPDFTFTSTALAPLLNNLKVVLVDVRQDNGNIDLTKIEEKITEKTVAISPVDYAGNPADMNAINEIAKKHNLYVVHDAAQSIGAEHHGRKTGGLADVSAFSFHGTKNLVVGEGGAITTDDDELASKIIIVREKGTDKHHYLTNSVTKGYYEYVSIGNSYVQSDILGALGRSQLKKIDWINGRRSKIADYYVKEFSRFEVGLPKVTENSKTNWHMFYLLLPEEKKEKFISESRKRGITTNIHYHPLHINTLYKEECAFHPDEFPGAMSFYSKLVRIPLYPALTDHEVEFIAAEISCVLTSLV
jgi:dTDP-4-amino-4,6-dideoxygalactose transaminase